MPSLKTILSGLNKGLKLPLISLPEGVSVQIVSEAESIDLRMDRFKSVLKHPLFYLGAIFLLTFGMSFVMAGMLVFDGDTFLYTFFWLFCFSFLTFNVNYMLVSSLYHLCLPLPVLAEQPLKNFPATAVIYPVKNEGTGLYERIRYSLLSNSGLPFDLWLLSDSSDPAAISYEEETLARLRKEFGAQKIRYRRRLHPFEKKQGNVMSWAHAHPEYATFFICDADTMIPPGTLEKLVRKAGHPENAGIAIFQSSLEIVHAKTYFAKFQAISTRLAQKLYSHVNQAIFKRHVSFGHGCLVRMAPFLQLRLPKGIWSHDIWDMALLDQMGYRTVFCPDGVTYDEVPADYLELLPRNRRWAKGTLQSWPLVFKPGISLATRFYVAYGMYVFIVQPVFFFWMLASFWAASASTGVILKFQRYAFLGGTLVDVELAGMAIFGLAVVFFHKLALCRSFQDFREVVQEILFSTLICLNNVFYQTLDILLLPFHEKGKGWVPAKKDPFSSIRLRDALKMLWPSTLLGLAGLYFGLNQSPQWAFGAMPFLISFSLIIPLTYATAQTNLLKGRVIA